MYVTLPLTCQKMKFCFIIYFDVKYDPPRFLNVIDYNILNLLFQIEIRTFKHNSYHRHIFLSSQYQISNSFSVKHCQILSILK